MATNPVAELVTGEGAVEARGRSRNRMAVKTPRNKAFRPFRREIDTPHPFWEGPI
ncbi:hypothetical protein NMD1_01919 [Novosphingobium sp. MD-1]|nr:hypothetical protein NMD1_01919 [Novosphingobium sp. MD-1]